LTFGLIDSQNSICFFLTTENLIFLAPRNRAGELLPIIAIETWHTAVSPMNISLPNRNPKERYEVA
jgi:hypothetical protein